MKGITSPSTAKITVAAFRCPQVLNLPKSDVSANFLYRFSQCEFPDARKKVVTRLRESIIVKSHTYKPNKTNRMASPVNGDWLNAETVDPTSASAKEQIRNS
jgi:hypothetical protein